MAYFTSFAITTTVHSPNRQTVRPPTVSTLNDDVTKFVVDVKVGRDAVVVGGR